VRVERQLFQKSYKFALEIEIADRGAYWTSGTERRGQFLWCPSVTYIDETFWIPSDNPKTEKCVSLVVGQASGLENTFCNKTLHVLCEYKENEPIDIEL